MKKYLVLFLFSCAAIQAQSTDAGNENSQIKLSIYIPHSEDTSLSALNSNLENKLLQIATTNGLSGGDNSRFIITANSQLITKDITPTAPPMHSVTVQLTLYIGDGVEGTVYSTYSMTLKGVGTNETKAYLAAIKNLKGADGNVQKFVEKGKSKIYEYYSRNCDKIIKSANLLASQGKFDESIFALSAVPDVGSTCTDKISSAMMVVYQSQIDANCKTLLLQATTQWNSDQSSHGASIASAYLAQIEPNASCYKDAVSLSSKIATKIRMNEQREWDFKMKEQKMVNDLQRDRLKAAREIAVAYAKSQNTYVYNVRGWW